MPRLLGVLVAVAGLGYVCDSVATVAALDLGATVMFTFVGELALALWLVARGAG